MMSLMYWTSNVIEHDRKSDLPKQYCDVPCKFISTLASTKTFFKFSLVVLNSVRYDGGKVEINILFFSTELTRKFVHCKEI